MKLRIVVAIGIIIGLAYCKDKNYDDYQSRGKITGPDLGMCICCGGWKIVIDDATYNFDSIPSGSAINLEKETFPLYVKLNWEMSGINRCPKWITIQKIVKEY